MKQDQFELLAGADAVQGVTLEWAGGGWAVVVNPGTKSVAIIQTARGEERIWRSLDVAHRWIEARGWAGDVSITGRGDQVIEA